MWRSQLPSGLKDDGILDLVTTQPRVGLPAAGWPDVLHAG